MISLRLPGRHTVQRTVQPVFQWQLPAVRLPGCVLPRPSVRRRAAPSPQDDAADALDAVEAMQEAVELFQQAQELAQRQVVQELMQMELSDMAYYHGGEDGPATTPATSNAQAGQQPPHHSPSQAKAAGPPPGSIRRVPIGPSAVQPLASFWLEQGLRPHMAQAVAKEMVAAGSPYCNIGLLEAQVQRLGRVIPSNVQDMVARDWRILNASPRTVAQHYVQLVQLFPATLDVCELACKQPRLLYCDDLVGQFEAVVAKLVQLHPSHSREEAHSLMVEYPELLFRMPYHMHASSLDDLPMELQNMFVITGQGLHHLHQHHSTSISPRFL